MAPVPKDVAVTGEDMLHDPRREAAVEGVCGAVVRADSRCCRAFGNSGSGLAAVTTYFVGIEY
ncbi:hypothetical protein CSPAE12_11412 [Colletotrichum incanum]|nr:hypothetical protein CSPAE12_11412 [Colletotrichum incanum]